MTDTRAIVKSLTKKVNRVSQTLHITNFCDQTYLLAYAGAINSCRTVKKIICETLKLEKVLKWEVTWQQWSKQTTEITYWRTCSSKTLNVESYIHNEDRMANSCSISIRTLNWTKKNIFSNVEYILNRYFIIILW